MDKLIFYQLNMGISSKLCNNFKISIFEFWPTNQLARNFRRNRRYYLNINLIGWTHYVNFSSCFILSSWWFRDLVYFSKDILKSFSQNRRRPLWKPEKYLRSQCFPKKWSLHLHEYSVSSSFNSQNLVPSLSQVRFSSHKVIFSTHKLELGSTVSHFSLGSLAHGINPTALPWG